MRAQHAVHMTPPTPLVLLPGLDGSDVFFRPFMAALPAWIAPRVVPYPRTGDQGYARLLAHVQAEVSDLPAFWVLGSSFGGPLALALAAAEPERIRGVVLSTSFARMPQPRLLRWRMFVRPPVIATIRTLRRLPVWLGRAPDDPFRRAKAETWRRVSAHELSARLRVVMQVDARPALAALPHPPLCLAASADTVVPAQALHAMLAMRPDARVATLRGSHMALFHDGRAAAEHVARFIAGT